MTRRGQITLVAVTWELVLMSEASAPEGLLGCSQSRACVRGRSWGSSSGGSSCTEQLRQLTGILSITASAVPSRARNCACPVKPRIDAFK